jgi:hypothetical protein
MNGATSCSLPSPAALAASQGVQIPPALLLFFLEIVPCTLVAWCRILDAGTDRISTFVPFRALGRASPLAQAGCFLAHAQGKGMAAVTSFSPICQIFSLPPFFLFIIFYYLNHRQIMLTSHEYGVLGTYSFINYLDMFCSGKGPYPPPVINHVFWNPMNSYMPVRLGAILPMAQPKRSTLTGSD